MYELYRTRHIHKLALFGTGRKRDMLRRRTCSKVEVDKLIRTGVLDKRFVFKLFNGVHVHCFGGNTAVVERINIA